MSENRNFFSRHCSFVAHFCHPTPGQLLSSEQVSNCKRGRLIRAGEKDHHASKWTIFSYCIRAQNWNVLQSTPYTKRELDTRPRTLLRLLPSLSRSVSLISLDGSKVFSIKSSAQSVICVPRPLGAKGIRMGIGRPSQRLFFQDFFSAQSFPQGDYAFAQFGLDLLFLPCLTQ